MNFLIFGALFHFSAEFSDMDVPEITIEDNSGRVVYMVRYGSTEHAIIWVWRELLLSSIFSNGDDGLAKVLVADIEKLDLAKAMVERLPGNDEESRAQLPMIRLWSTHIPTVAPEVSESPKYGTEEYEKRDWKLEERRDLLLNAHWTPEMRAAVPKLKALLISSQVAEFKRKPTTDVYYTIVGATPELSQHLLASARVHFFDSKDPNISLHPAFGIFKAAGADEDLLHLLDSATAQNGRNGVTRSNQLEAISYLMSRPGDVRTKARVHLESGLQDAQNAVISAMEHAFPTLPSAWRYLKKQVDGGILPKADKTSTPEPSRGFYNQIHNGVHPRPVDAARGPVLKAFCDKAGWTAAEGCSSEDDEDEEMYDDWRYQSRDEKEDITVDVISTLQQWVQVLDKWPITEEQGAIKKKMRALHKNGQAFFDVDGVADALARRYANRFNPLTPKFLTVRCSCDWGSDPCRQKLGRAIRQLYYSFAEDGPEKERIKQDVPKHLGFYVV